MQQVRVGPPGKMYGRMRGGGLRPTGAADGSLPSGRAIAGQYGRHERWGRMVKKAGLAGDLGA
jgi:hypothetical protein